MASKSLVGGLSSTVKLIIFSEESLAELNVSRNEVVSVQDLEKLPFLASGK